MRTANPRQSADVNPYPIFAKASRSPANAASIKSVKLFFLFGILLVMGTLTARAANPIDALVQDKRVALAMSWVDKNLDWVTEQQIAITEIPAPEFHEAQRAAYLAKVLASCGLDVHTDSVGNVIGERGASSGKSKDVILVVAHLDTVFPADRRSGRIFS